MSAFAHIQQTTEPLSITHQGQFPAITVSFDIAPGSSLGAAIEAVDQAQRDLHMPASLQGAFQGTAASFSNSLSNEPLLILAAMVAVYIVLGVLYESFIHPDHDSLDAALRGRRRTAGACMLFHQDLNVVALIGIILLIGIVNKNGIMMVDFALDAERKRGQERHRCDL